MDRIKLTVALPGVVMLIATLVSCRDNYDEWESNLISGYVQVEGLAASYTSVASGHVGEPLLNLMFTGDFVDKSRNPVAYDSLAAYFGDTDFNRNVSVASPRRVAMDRALNAVRIVSVDNFNSRYGPDADITPDVMVVYRSYGPYVLNGYCWPGHSLNPNDFLRPRKYQSPASGLDRQSNRLMSEWLSLAFTSVPDRGEHTIMVDFMFEGKTISDTITFLW